MKRLVITADDFGLSPKLDPGIRQALERGVVTHVSLLANGASTEEAVRFLKGRSSTSAAIHLNLTDGRPLAGCDGMQMLLDSGGFFRGSHWRAAAVIMSRPSVIPSIERECRAQIERVLSLGLRPAQLNSHGHLHAVPEIFDVVSRLASEYGIPYVRRVEERLSKSHFFQSPARWAKTLLLRTAFAARRNQIHAKSIPCVGVYNSGRLNPERLDRVLEGLTDGDHELICHPGGEGGTPGPEEYRNWGYHWQDELDLLLSGHVEDSLKKAQIQLVNFRQLERTMHAN